MAVITLNLLAEEQTAQQERARDPVKAAIAIGVGLIALVVGAGAVMSVIASQKKGEVAGLQAQYDKLNSPKLREIEAQFATLKQEVEEIEQVNHSRYLFAPRLALVKNLVPDNVQLDRMTFSVASETVQPESKPGGKAARPKVVDRLTLRLTGKAVSNHPELDVDAFIQTLRENPAFSENIDQIQLRSIARSATSSQPGTAGLPAANFVVECLYKERE